MNGTRSRFEGGSSWAIWDLHVHTPSSLVSNYGGGTPENWSQFLDELESLPSDIRVIGINDYWFLDGYLKVLQARKDGRLKNIDTIFPVVEFRIPQFGGTAGSLSRVNLHAIFDPELSPMVIEQQFLGRLNGSFRLRPGLTSTTWDGAVTRESLTDLGREIIVAAPPSEQGKYRSPLIEGFNNLCIPIEQVQSILSSSYLRGRAILGAGKVEWARWPWRGRCDGSDRPLRPRPPWQTTPQRRSSLSPRLAR